MKMLDNKHGLREREEKRSKHWQLITDKDKKWHHMPRTLSQLFKVYNASQITK